MWSQVSDIAMANQLNAGVRLQNCQYIRQAVNWSPIWPLLNGVTLCLWPHPSKSPGLNCALCILLKWMYCFMKTSSNGTFSASLAICEGKSPASGEFPAQMPVRRSFNVFFDLCLNKRWRKQSWGWIFEMLSRPLWRHCNVSCPNNRLAVGSVVLVVHFIYE